MRALDLFAGAGGLSQGLKESGFFKSVLAVEMDPEAAATFSQNHRDAEIFVGRIQDWLASSDVPSVDIIVGGPPCQGFSTLGKQDGQDERNALWREYVETIIRARPTYFVVENVPAFLKSREFESLEAEIGSSGRLSDYAFQVRILNAADFGAAQARRRAVLIGHRRDVPFPGWPVKTHEGRHISVREAFAPIPKGGLWRDLPDRSYESGDRVYAGPFKTSELHVSRRYSELSLQRFVCIPPGGNRFDIAEELLPPCWKGHTSGSSDVMGRLHWRRPAVTIRTEFFKPEKGRYLHPQEHRAITHLEAALLQGFPLDYKWVGTKLSIARQIGNAVPIPLAAAIANQIGKSAAERARESVVSHSSIR